MTRVTHGIHATDKCIISRSVILCRQEKTASLRRCEIDHIRLCRLRIDAVDLDNGYGMVLKPDPLASKGSDIHHTEEICLSRFDLDLEVLGLVEQCGIGNRLGTGRVKARHELGNKVGHLVVVPVGDREDVLLIVHALERAVWIRDDERRAEPVRILAPEMGVIPVGAWLINL